jgi:hypothetical protein
MKRILAVGVVTFMMLGISAPPPTSAQGKQAGTLMTQKLKNSQKLLEGIALADFKKVISSADELIQLSKTAEWRVHTTPRYELYSNEFRRAAETLIQKAQNKNIDGTTLAFFEMTMSCVRCHQYVREIRDARLEDREAIRRIAAR